MSMRNEKLTLQAGAEAVEAIFKRSDDSKLSETASLNQQLIEKLLIMK